jgi:hypothetical protein
VKAIKVRGLQNHQLKAVDVNNFQALIFELFFFFFFLFFLSNNFDSGTYRVKFL